MLVLYGCVCVCVCEGDVHVCVYNHHQSVVVLSTDLVSKDNAKALSLFFFSYIVTNGTIIRGLEYMPMPKCHTKDTAQF